ncbi:hypothetical protein C100_04345 [Sphingobium sp. C100]|uniref:DUF2840 domain-containing protein n=1 Tax=Sphingobium sp. C100 TaxID=1207055 RepID=UPI0003D5B9E7|nr:DUF2840 domain-containing protein [Sphingobium sp. C100]ETI64970.1 hypothetical protein C100_04345 [Sphingobium sp. C100]
MSDRHLTAVRLLHRRDQADAWLRFGEPVAERLRGRSGIACFPPGRLFGYVDWRANDYGTIRWTFTVARTAAPGGAIETIPGVRPGAELLLRASGKAAVKRAFAYLDTIDATGIDPALVDPDHWRAAANRIAAREDPRPFDPLTHAAAMARRTFST